MRLLLSDLDGDGALDEVHLTENGYLRYQEQLIRLRPVDPSGARREYEIVEIELDARQRALLVTLPESGAEDPPWDHQVFSIRGGVLANILEDGGVLTTPHGVRPTLTGKGRLQVVGMKCIRDAEPPEARNGIEARTVESYRWIPETEEIAKVSMERTLDRRTRCGFAACPFVRVDGVERGETLTNLRDASLAGTQLTDLGIVGRGRLEVELLERKPEVTRASKVAVRVGSEELRPLRCAAPRGLAVPGCGDIRNPLILKEGESEVFVFDVPKRGNAALHVTGYYLVTDGTSVGPEPLNKSVGAPREHRGSDDPSLELSTG
ncbi:MAG: hypothetical protein ACRBN8_32355 [Nannocystales bacterium]